MLSCGERYIRCLIGEDIDRVPYGVGIGWWPWGETMDRWRAESGNPDLDLSEEFGYDLSTAAPDVRCGIWPCFNQLVLDQDDEFVVLRDEYGITKRTRRGGGSIPEFLDYPVKTPEDWETLKRERLIVGDPSRICQDWNVFQATIKDKGEAVQVGDFPYGVFGMPRDLMGAEELLISFHTEPEMVRDMMEHMTSVWISVWREIAAEVRIDQIHIWEDMSGRQGSLISPAMVREFMMPCYDRIAEFGRSVGVRVISVDTDGDCSELVPLMMEHGVNMFFPFEVQAGNDLLDYRKKYPDLGIVGGLDKRALAQSKHDIDAEVEKAARMVERGRYIPGFDHLIPPDVPWENFIYAASKLKKICYGG